MKKVTGVSTLAQKLLSELNWRFRFVLDPSNVCFDGIYITSTLLNPSYKKLLGDNLIAHAKKFLLEAIKKTDEMSIGENSLSAASQSDENVTASSEPGPPFKRFKHLSRVCDLLAQQEVSQEEVTQLSKEEEEINRYIGSKHSNDEMKIDPLQFWIDASKSYPLISGIACDILCTPASTAPVERLFSYSGEATKGKRNRLKDNNLERETLLRKNKIYI